MPCLALLLGFAQVTLTRDALQQWCELDPLLRRVVLATLLDLTEGRWNMQQEQQKQQQQQQGTGGGRSSSSGLGVTQRQHLGGREMVESDEDVWLALQRLARVKAYTTTFLQVRGAGGRGGGREGSFGLVHPS